MSAFCQAAFRTSGGFGGVNDFCVSQSRDGLLLYDDGLAYHAVGPLCQSFLCTGRRDRRIGHQHMAMSRNGGLRYQHLAAYGTMFSFCQAGLGTGWFHGRVDDLDMPTPGLNDSPADKAYLILRAGSLRPIGMPGGGNDLLCLQHFTADGAVLALGQTSLGAGRIHGGVYDFGMSLGRDHFLRHQYLVANGTVLALGQAGLGAG